MRWWQRARSEETWPVVNRFRRTSDPRAAAEAAFKTATAPPREPDPPKAPSVPGAKETITLRVDRDVLEFFQADGPGWQDRINAVLRRAAGK